MDELKLETMSKWPTPTKRKEVQAFLSFANYYGRFFTNYSAEADVLIQLMKDIYFSWGFEQQPAIDDIQ